MCSAVHQDLRIPRFPRHHHQPADGLCTGHADRNRTPIPAAQRRPAHQRAGVRRPVVACSLQPGFKSVRPRGGSICWSYFKRERAWRLPVVQSAKFELVANMTTAKPLRLAIPNAIARRWRCRHRRPPPFIKCTRCGGIAVPQSLLDSRDGKKYRLLRCIGCEKLRERPPQLAATPSHVVIG